MNQNQPEMPGFSVAEMLLIQHAMEQFVETANMNDKLECQMVECAVGIVNKFNAIMAPVVAVIKDAFEKRRNTGLN